MKKLLLIGFLALALLKLCSCAMMKEIPQGGFVLVYISKIDTVQYHALPVRIEWENSKYKVITWTNIPHGFHVGMSGSYIIR